MVMAFGSFYASFVRAHKSLRSYANPAYFLVSSIKFIGGKKQPAGMPKWPSLPLTRTSPKATGTGNWSSS